MSSATKALLMPKPYCKLKYTHNTKSVDITDEISNSIISITYTDKGHAGSDSVNLTLLNTSLKWMDAWKPDMGDKIEITLGYEDDDSSVCGSFEVCQNSFSGPPDTISITAEGTKYTDPWRDVRTVNFGIDENGEEKEVTLKDVINAIKDESYSSYKIVGLDTVETVNVTEVQKNESDLTFLKRLADTYGYFFKVNYDNIVFYKKDKLEKEEKIKVERDEVKSYSFSEESVEAYKSVVIVYNDVDKHAFKECKISDNNVDAGKIHKEKVFTKLSDEDAKKMAKNKIVEKNKAGTTANLDLKGNVKLVTGKNIKLSGFKKFDGEYSITSTTHSLSRSSGYTSKINLMKFDEASLTEPEIIIRDLKVVEE